MLDKIIQFASNQNAVALGLVLFGGLLSVLFACLHLPLDIATLIVGGGLAIIRSEIKGTP